MTSISQSIAELQELHSQEMQWDTTTIDVLVAKSYTDDTPFSLNLAYTLGYNVRVSTTDPDPDVYWMPRIYDENNP